MTKKFSQVFILLLSVFVVALHLFLVIKYSVNAPDLDDYDAVLKFANGFVQEKSIVAKTQSMFAQHNEHRIFLDRFFIVVNLVTIGTINFTGLALIGNLFMILMFLLFARIFKEFVSTNWWLFFPVPLLTFSLESFENFVWAMASMQNVGVVLFAVASLYFLLRTREIVVGDFVIAAILALLATYTSGNGMLTFIVAAIGMVSMKKPLKWILLWGAISVVGVVSYFYGYHSVGGHPDPIATITERPDQLISHFFVLLGCIADDLAISVFLGFVFSVLFIFLILNGVHQRRAVLFFILCFFILSSCLVSLTRGGFGVGQAMSMRYRLYSELIVLFFYFLVIVEARLDGYRRIVVGLFFATVAFLYIRSFSQNIPEMRARHDNLAQGVAHFNAGNQIFHLSYPDQIHAHYVLTKSLALGIYKLPSINLSDLERTTVEETLPEEEGLVQSAFEIDSTNGQLFVDSASTFIEGQKASDISVYVVIKNEQETLIFRTVRYLKQRETSDRRDVSWFTQLKGLSDGKYALGFYVKTPQKNAFDFTGAVLTVASGKLTVQQDPHLKCKFSVDAFENASDSIHVKGWVFVVNADAAKIGRKIILRSGSIEKAFEPEILVRPDVSAAYNGNYDLSGFDLRTPRDNFSPGRYALWLEISYEGVIKLIDTKSNLEIKK
ncbi:hypothetical protein [Chryseolinea lacunae]|uniref:Glycosyltransferase RgtA/B/C/D-like domain-containing protein n=1 Tax=Chryseolinea lacunae TaxID=2801331 RepID=A0ABS1KS11_9BACT|nr:hypothetical protein [Chryseolinea lacunae]MBL0742211.1 hypothetical protein [Chryseolinea lacunae]